MKVELNNKVDPTLGGLFLLFALGVVPVTALLQIGLLVLVGLLFLKGWVLREEIRG